jgi:hypothetical protein
VCTTALHTGPRPALLGPSKTCGTTDLSMTKVREIDDHPLVTLTPLALQVATATEPNSRSRAVYGWPQAGAVAGTVWERP